MDKYESSVARVDAALARLNATLESYRIVGAKKPASSAANSSSQVNGTSTRSAPRAADRHVIDNHSEPSQRPVEPQAGPIDAVWQEILDLRLRTAWELPQLLDTQTQACIDSVVKLQALLDDHPYSLPIYIALSHKYFRLGYPDLAAGAAYKALLLSDAVRDSSDEYHAEACTALRELLSQQPLTRRIAILKEELNAGLEAHEERMLDLSEEQDVEMDVWMRGHYLGLIYHMLVRSLVQCGCLSTADEYAHRLMEHYPDNAELLRCTDEIDTANAERLGVAKLSDLPSDSEDLALPDKGFVRREKYPWNTHEPDRYQDLDELNRMMQQVAPKLEIRAVQLPSLATSDTQTTVTQLGVFAKQDILPGEAILTETSILTANNKLQDTLCDACSADLPPISSPSASQIQSCDSCEAVFCSPTCHDAAQSFYHPAVCDTDAETLAKDVAPSEAADALYSLLLLRTLAMAETQAVHPLQLDQVKYIWGDFVPARHDLPTAQRSPAPCIAGDGTPPNGERLDPPPPSSSSSSSSSSSPSPSDGHAKTLPFSFSQNISLPFHMLEKMNVDIFAHTSRYDVWVFNTLYAKFRGTASARLSGSTGKEPGGNERGGDDDDDDEGKRVVLRKVRGPEVSAVHPMWCMANHSCDPNVGWEWGGSVTFTAREERVEWTGREGRAQAGIEQGEEVLNHYCDINLPVKERREWARGALGGDCQCSRCIFEAGAE